MTDKPTAVEEYLSDAGSREKSGGRIDYDSLCTIGIGAILSAPLGSITRAYALMDLQDLLAPYQDETFQLDWGKLNEDYLGDGQEEEEERPKPIIRYRNHDRSNGHSDPEQGAAFQRGWLRLLIRLMKKKGLLPAGYI